MLMWIAWNSAVARKQNRIAANVAIVLSKINAQSGQFGFGFAQNQIARLKGVWKF